MSVHQTKDGRWFVNYYQPGERKKARRAGDFIKFYIHVFMVKVIILDQAA